MLSSLPISWIWMTWGRLAGSSIWALLCMNPGTNFIAISVGFSFFFSLSVLVANETWFVDFAKVRYSILWSTLPTQFALWVLFDFFYIWVTLNWLLISFYSDCFSMFFIHHLTSLLLVSWFACTPSSKFSIHIWQAVSLDNDVNTNKELVAHGYSNFLAGLVGTV